MMRRITHVLGIREALEQAQRLIRDLLDVQKAEAGRLVLHFERTDLAVIVDDCLNNLRHEIEEKQLRVERGLPAALSPVHGDPDRITQIVMNVLGNAVKFSSSGGTIRLHAEHKADRIVISVRDQGPGIPADELPYIFDRYWQAKKTGKVGHGIGLAIVQALTRAHGGEVWAESKPGVGSRFYFTLPVHQ